MSRFHAVYWPAILLCAGVPLPDEICIHAYVTIDGRKISKSLGNVIDPADAASCYGIDALRYFLLRHIGTHHDGDFSWARFDAAYETELANGLGNLVCRTAAMIERYYGGKPPPRPAADPIGVDSLERDVDAHVRDFTLHRALEAVFKRVDAANAYINHRAPWKTYRDGDFARTSETLGHLRAALLAIARNLQPFLPGTAERILETFGNAEIRQTGALFPKVR